MDPVRNRDLEDSFLKKKDLYILVWGMVRSKSFCDVKVVKVEDNQARLIAQHLCAK
jgi:hypothetical protein